MCQNSLDLIEESVPYGKHDCIFVRINASYFVYKCGTSICAETKILNLLIRTGEDIRTSLIISYLATSAIEGYALNLELI